MLELLESQGKIISKPLDFHCMCGCTLLLVGGGTCWHLAFREETLARSYHPKKSRWKPEIRSIRSPLLLCSSWCLVPKVPKGSLVNCATVPVSSEGHHSNIHGFPISIQSQPFFFCITCWWVFIVMCWYHVSMRFTWVSAGETCRLSQTLAHTQSQDALSDSDFPTA